LPAPAARPDRENTWQHIKSNPDAKLRFIDRGRTDQERRGWWPHLELSGYIRLCDKQGAKDRPTVVSGHISITPVLGIEMAPALD
jgi:hypothetical protein